MGRLTSAAEHDTRSHLWHPRPRLDRRRQMHRERDRTDDARRMMHQPNELTQRGLPDEVRHAVERRMPVARLAALHELQLPLEVIDHPLIARRIPPLRREVVLSTRHHDPELVG
jgi:hypothetical protein